MRQGFLYLVAVMDWATCKVLAWRLSNTMEADFCVAALKDAAEGRDGRPWQAQRRPRSALGDRTPDEAYAIEIQQKNLAA